MNEFTAKKLGEVLAFASVGLETAERGQKGLTDVIGTKEVNNIITTNKQHAAALQKLAEENGSFGRITLNKSITTGDKLRKMRDLYVGDEWDNGVELLEWSGFFEGAALVHWQLVSGAAETLKSDTLKKISKEAVLFHRGFLDHIEKTLHSIGETRSK